MLRLTPVRGTLITCWGVLLQPNPAPGANEGNGLWQSGASRHIFRHMPFAPRTPMTIKRHVRLFRNGRNQAVRIPKEFELEGEEAIMRKEGNRLILEPVEKSGLLLVLAGLQAVEDPFPDVDADLPDLDEIDLHGA